MMTWLDCLFLFLCPWLSLFLCPLVHLFLYLFPDSAWLRNSAQQELHFEFWLNLHPPCRESVRICALKLVVSLDRNNALDINNFSSWIIFNSITKKVFELLRAYIIGDNMSISGHHKKFITQTKFQRNLNSWLRFESPVSSSL